jgi:hypothetical protein
MTLKQLFYGALGVAFIGYCLFRMITGTYNLLMG